MLIRPKPGDLVVGCKHAPDIHSSHWFKAPPGDIIRLPDGKTGKVEYVVMCDLCKRRFDEGENLVPGVAVFWPEDGGSVTVRERRTTRRERRARR